MFIIFSVYLLGILFFCWVTELHEKFDWVKLGISVLWPILFLILVAVGCMALGSEIIFLFTESKESRNNKDFRY